MIRPEGQIDSLANKITATGDVLVLAGLHRGIDTPAGAALTASGLFVDVVDGPVARARGENSDLGALFDASSDKLKGAAIAYSIWRKGIVPDVVIAGMAVQNLANGIATAQAAKNHPGEKLLPSKRGKISMLFQNTALMSYDYGRIMENRAQELAAAEIPDVEKIAKCERSAKYARKFGHVAAGIGVVGLGIPATLGYIKRIKK